MKYNEKDGIQYPELAAAKPKDGAPLTKYGTLYKNYLQEKEPGRYAVLLHNLELMSVCHRVENEANRYEGTVLKKLRSQNPPPKTDDTMVMIQYNNELYRQAQEITTNDVIYRR